MRLTIAISSGKGGTGKTFIATNLARALEEAGQSVCYLDCDVEAPNGHLFLKPQIHDEEPVTLLSPSGVNEDLCLACGKCADVCRFNAIALINKKVLFFKELCHVCGACTIACPQDAIVEKERKIGALKHGKSGTIDFHYGLLETAEGGMSARLISSVKEKAIDGINILDAPPGTSCPVVETVKDVELCVLVTDPTPFGIHDLKLAVSMCRELGQEPVVIVNRATSGNEALNRYCKEACLTVIAEIPDDRNIAECYSEGGLVFDQIITYQPLFAAIADKILQLGEKKRPVHQQENCRSNEYPVGAIKSAEAEESAEKVHNTREVVIISGKGGTGKTSIAACFSALEPEMAVADCDVDAADFHLILHPEVQEKGIFSGGDLAVIDLAQCSGCGACMRHCRFDAVLPLQTDGPGLYMIDEKSCEGCGVCGLVCPDDAIYFEPALNGEWFISKTRFGPMSHARLRPAEENSGKLVTLVRKHLDRIAGERGAQSLIDGSPGTGCPVIASITGAAFAVIVTEPTVSGIHDLKRVMDVVHFFKIPSGVIVNKADLNASKTREIETYISQNGSEFLGTIPYDPVVTEAQVKGIAVVELIEDGIAIEIKKIWAKVRRRIYVGLG